MKVCVPVRPDGSIDPRWGRAERVAVAAVVDGRVEAWEEFAVGWDRLHEEGPEGVHHARIARFLQEHRIELVVADHMGQGMAQMLGSLNIAVRLGASGPAREAVVTGPLPGRLLRSSPEP